MISNGTLKDIGKVLFNAVSVILFPHESPDGDSVGACVALCNAMRQRGVDAWILLDEKLAEYIDFLGNDFCTTDWNCVEKPDVCAFIDCCGDDRIGERALKLHQGKELICIDHHSTSEGCDGLYYIDPDRAACTELVYQLLLEAGAGCGEDAPIRFNREITNGIYTGICTDTGNFRYSNTNPETHRIAGELMDIGVDHERIMIRLYQSVDPAQTRLESAALAEMETFAGGRGAIVCISQELLRECGAGMDHAENLINVLRDIRGVEVAAVLKEKTSGTVKVGFRAKSCVDVSAVAARFGGGGHVKASGCTIHDPMSRAKTAVIRAVEEALKRAQETSECIN